MNMNLKKYIAEIKDFPIKGILFKDICPLLANPKAFAYAVKQMTLVAKKYKPNVIVGPESRGFIFGCPLALALNIPFIPVRKPGKLPRKKYLWKSKNWIFWNWTMYSCRRHKTKLPSPYSGWHSCHRGNIN